MSVRSLLICLVVPACLSCGGPRAPEIRPMDRGVGVDLRTLAGGLHAEAVTQVVKDLQQAGFTVAHGKLLQPMLGDNSLRLDALHELPMDLLWAGRHFEADLLVLVEVGESVAYPSVVVKGFDLETGELLWRGVASPLGKVREMEYDQVVRNLTHRALLDGLNDQGEGPTAVLSSFNARPQGREQVNRERKSVGLADSHE